MAFGSLWLACFSTEPLQNDYTAHCQYKGWFKHQKLNLIPLALQECSRTCLFDLLFSALIFLQFFLVFWLLNLHFISAHFLLLKILLISFLVTEFLSHSFTSFPFHFHSLCSSKCISQVLSSGHLFHFWIFVFKLQVNDMIQQFYITVISIYLKAWELYTQKCILYMIFFPRTWKCEIFSKYCVSSPQTLNLKSDMKKLSVYVSLLYQQASMTLLTS